MVEVDKCKLCGIGAKNSALIEERKPGMEEVGRGH
jgi:hypothetical protein